MQDPSSTAGPYNRSLLHQAGQLPEVRRLLAAGARVNARDSQGWTPLHLAAVRGFAAIAEVLLQHGADATAQDLADRTPQHLTARSGSTAVAELLLQHGASLAAADCRGRTPLHDAAMRGLDGLMRVYLQHAGDAAAAAVLALQEDHAHMTPLQCAAHRGHEAVVQQLLPFVLRAPAAQAVAAMQDAAVAAVASSYTQVAVLLIKELGRQDPSTVAAVVDQLQGRGDDSCRALLSAVVLQWVADCAAVPQRQQQIRREQAEVDVLQRRVQHLCLSVAVALRGGAEAGNSEH